MVYVFSIQRGTQKAIIAGAVVFSILPIAAVILRMIARSRLKDSKLDLSDWLIIFACLVAVGYQGLAVACVAVGGMGFHTAEILAMAGEDSLTILLELVTAVVIFWSLSLGLTKLSILALYSKIFSIRSFILTSQACAVFVILWAIILFIGAFAICTPVQYNWDRFSVAGTCGDIRMLWAVTGGLNIFSDLVIMLLPMPYLYGLSLQTYKKVGLMATFGIGLAVCIVSTVRLAEIIKIDMNDFAFSGGIALMFSALEPCLLVTAACIPLLRPLVSRNNSQGQSSGYASGHVGGRSNNHNNSENHSRKGGFLELQDDDGSTRQLDIGQSKYGGDETTVTELDSFDSSDRVSNHHVDLELKYITVKRDWRVEASSAV